MQSILIKSINMEIEEKWVDVAVALQLLQVKRESLYAYVSRKYVRSKPVGGRSRASLYALSDIEKMAAKRRRPRKRAEVAQSTIKWGEPILETRVSTVKNGRLVFGKDDACKLAETCTLEQIAAHHWRAGTPPVSAFDPYAKRDVGGVTAKARAFSHLATLAADSPSILGRERSDLCQEAHILLSGFADSIIGRSYTGLIHHRLGRSWTLSPQNSDLLRRALVLISDHELNASTFAVRVAASTGASLPAAAMAGLAALSGPLHGDASVKATSYLRGALQSESVKDYVAKHPDIPGMGHRLYPSGDIRAKALIKAIDPPETIQDALTVFESASGELPNVDMAHAVLACHLNLPPQAGFVIFALGRMSGWLAHAMEQNENGDLIRPRAVFQNLAE